MDSCPICDGHGYTIEKVRYEQDGSAITDKQKCEYCDGHGKIDLPLWAVI